jgi:hypothetical protein
MVKAPVKQSVQEEGAPGETWVHVPPSQQSAQGPVPKPGEPIKADSPEVVAPKVMVAKKVTPKGQKVEEKNG